MDVSYHPFLDDIISILFLRGHIALPLCLSSSDLYCLLGEPVSPDTWDEGEHFKRDKQ